MAYGNILGQRPNLSGYVTTEQLNQILSNYVTNSNLSGQLNNYVTNTSLSSQLGNYVTNNALNTQLDNYLELSGGTMTGQLDMGSKKIINVPDGVDNGDAVNFGQLNDTINGSIPFANSGLTFLGRYTGVRTNNNDVTITTTGNMIYYSFISSLNINGTGILNGTVMIQKLGGTSPIYIKTIDSNKDIITLGTFVRSLQGNTIIFTPGSSNIMAKYYYDFYVYTGY